MTSLFQSPFTRRSFLKAGLAQSAVVLLAGPKLVGLARAAEPTAGLCLTICNHWSYIGIGWQLGIESCVLSATDAMEMADRPPHAKTCINLDARAYEFLAECFPEVAQRLRRQLAAGKVELIGGTYGQPMGTTIGGESNIRQIVLGREVIRQALGYEMVTFLEEEEFTHPQVPQLAALAGFRYASLAQLDTWGRAGCPPREFNVVTWKGIDGTTIPCVPKNSLFGYSPDMKKLVESASFKKLQTLGKPLLFTWEEFGWESPEQPAYLSAPAKYQALADQQSVEFVTLKDYLDKYGGGPQEIVNLRMDEWNKSLTWGLGGDQVRILDRKVEGLLLAAELFDAVAAALGSPSQADDLELAWRNLLASQSHDVGLCEYSRWQGDRMAPLDRIEDFHNLTWGAIGFRHLDEAQRQGQAVIRKALGLLVERIDSQREQQGPLALTIFNPQGWDRKDLVLTGRIYPIPSKARGVVVKDRTGRVLPSQVLKSSADEAGNLEMAELAFLPESVPSAGYETYYLDLAVSVPAPVSTDLRFDEAKLVMENEFIRVALDPLNGAVASLLHKSSGQEMFDGKRAAFPQFSGRPNPNLSLTPKPPARYDSGPSKARIDWVERGPVRATIRARHSWQYLMFETQISLTAGAPMVEVTTRVLAHVPPHSDSSPPDIHEGYWVALALAFEPLEVVRDYPLAIEATGKDAFHALTFVDLVAKDFGLLVLHAGTQYFRRQPGNVIANLLMREWESHFTREYGWPVYVEYRHGLLPHGPGLSNTQRLRAAAAFTRPMLAVVSPPRQGQMPPSKSFIRTTPDHVQLSAFRKRTGPGFELRVVEHQGAKAEAAIELGLPVRSVQETDLIGRKLADVAQADGRLKFEVDPWKIRTFQIQ